MDKFRILEINSIIEDENKGSKVKYWTKINSENALIKPNKYLENNPSKDIRSWNVSEKVYSEIANYLGFSCVKTDFVINENNCYGIASYDYKTDRMNNISSGDDLFFSVFNRVPEKNGSKKDKITKKDYCYENILKILLHYSNDGKLVIDFNKIMVMDALTGEMDRHYENWGIFCLKNNKYELLPAYDNSSCLLHLFRDEKILNNTIAKTTIKEYAEKSECKVSINGKVYSHFEFIDYLLNSLPLELKMDLINDIKKLENLTDDYINSLLNRVPDCLCSEKHKQLIIEYIIIRRNILLSKVV